MKIIILDFESFFEVLESTAEFLGSTEDACEVVVGDSTVAVTFLSQGHCLVKQFEGHVKVFYCNERVRLVLIGTYPFKGNS